jgi:TolB protein
MSSRGPWPVSLKGHTEEGRLMDTNISSRKTCLHTPHTIFGTLVLLMTLALVGALGGGYADADSVANDSEVEGESSAPAPPARPAKRSATIPMSSGIIAFEGNDCRVGRPDGCNYGIWTINANGGNLRQLTTETGAAPDISPGGAKIAYGVGYAIYVMNIDGTGQHPIPNALNLTEYDPAWSPDGNLIAFSAYTQTTAGIWVMNADGTNQHRITSFPAIDGTDDDPSWSVNGKIAFERHLLDGTSEIYTVNANGSGLLNITNTSASNDRHPSWSPDGTKIAYTRTTDTIRNIAVMNADGTNQHDITNNPFGDQEPDWSPDGTEIVFSGFSGIVHDPDFFITDQNGGNRRNITNSPDDFSERAPSWAPGNITPVVRVQGEDGLPIQGAQVYNECAFVGTTNISGTVTLTSPLALYDRLIARKQVHEEPTQKGGHDGWAYHVWLTNITEENDGSETVFVVTDTNQITQTIVISSTNTQIGFNIVASVEYNDTAAHLDEIKQGFLGASKYLMDIADGQMYFEQVKLYDEGQHFNDADFQFSPWTPMGGGRASADAEPDGISCITATGRHIWMYGPGDFTVPYTQLSAQGTLVHEFFHYAIGAYDEYYKFNIDDYPTQCTLDFNLTAYEERASLMFDPRDSSEACATLSPLVHNPDTAQGYIQGESVWETLVNNYSDALGLWELKSPITRGVVDPGPSSPLCFSQYATSIETINSPAPVCDPPLSVLVVFQNGQPAVGADVTLHHNGSYIEEPLTDINGTADIFGVWTGDTVHAGMLVAGQPYNGSAVVVDCLNTVHITLIQPPSSASRRQDAERATGAGQNQSQTPNVWPAYWLEGVPDWAQSRITATLHLGGDPPGMPTLYASQDHANRQQLSLTYNPSLHQYTGTYTFNLALSPDFLFELELPTDSGVAASTYTFVAGQFHTNGPSGYEKMKNVGAPHGNNPSTPPQAWNILRPESQADVIVNPSSLPDGTGVMVGKSGMPVDRPNGLVPVGGPYSVQGQNPISGEVGITLAYQSEYFCGLVPGSASIYRYTGSGWTAIPTNLIDDWHQAGGKTTQWGIYGVFAQPNPQVVFSDVPVGSTFYDYINWITCHGIASGYADGTFRPNNNATRGQISKMVALAYKWRLEAPQAQQKSAQGGLEPIQWQWSPSVGGYTFADVLPGSTFFLYIEAAYREGVVSGYPCGGNGEPCDPQHRPYFRPSRNVTRGQIAKIISNAAHYDDTPTGQSFQDVVVGSTFYTYTQRIASRGIINGYPCGGAGEPCVPPGNLPYFRPNNNATRGQLSKMIYLALQPR